VAGWFLKNQRIGLSGLKVTSLTDQVNALTSEVNALTSQVTALKAQLPPPPVSCTADPGVRA
jgi:hypothetical protein